MSTHDCDRADRVAARATAVGIGLIVFMFAWTVGVAVTERLLDAPLHAYAAMGSAVLAGSITTLWSGRRLVRQSKSARLASASATN